MRRTKPATIGEILEEFFHRPYIAAKLAEGHLPDYWREIVGERIAANTSSLRLENHILHVHIDSSVLRQEVFFHRDDIMQRLNMRAGHRIVNVIIVR